VKLPRDLIEQNPGLGEWSILLAYRGSIAHGTYEPNSKPGSIDDKDVIGICVPPLEMYFGLRQFGSRGTQEIVRDPWDVVLYESRKALGLLAKGNPNVLAMLWLPESLYIDLKPAGRLIIDHRDLFAARSTFYPFMGYARSQLTKMERGAYKGYMGEKRRKLVEQRGYDTKNAAHLIRLLRMGIEFMRDGELQVVRPDATELLAIKHGEWTMERVKTEAERLFARAEDAFDRSPLPAKPDWGSINRLAVEVVQLASAGKDEA
jgi:predicted nucleotidyltransferase